jgi:hypothetical protein
LTYHFNMHDGRAYPDTLAMHCPTLEAARVEAVQRIGKLLAEDAARFWTGDEWTMDVTDGNGLTLFTLMFMATESPATGLGRAEVAPQGSPLSPD